MTEPLTDEWIICEWMDPHKDDGEWWVLKNFANFGHSYTLCTMDLTLDLLYRVEERLTDLQWMQYGACCWKWYTEAETANDYEISHFNRWRRRLMHLSVKQKTAALAVTIRSMKEL